ncbi:unnamed protein product [Staurois parvus]|uniref:Uncharacterized protein n=1 Tax=Staurois parvus TaxID=386267 RepID=A0ABN9D910_9NEOB|nr:unnamed protein product [Staurois parvus]
MPLVPFFIGFFECGQGHRGPKIPYCLGPHELSVRPCMRLDILQPGNGAELSLTGCSY